MHSSYASSSFSIRRSASNAGGSILGGGGSKVFMTAVNSGVAGSKT